MEGRIGLVTVLTDDIASMEGFYTDFLGFMVIEDLCDYVEFRNEGVRFAVGTSGILFVATANSSYREESSGRSPL